MKDIENKLSEYTQTIWNDGLPAYPKLRTYFILLKLITIYHILSRNCSNMRAQLLPNSDVELYRSVLRLDVFVMNVSVTVFVYSVQNSVLKMKNIFFYIALCIKICDRNISKR